MSTPGSLEKDVTISAIVIVSDRCDDIEVLYEGYLRALQAAGVPFEFIFVLDGSFPEVVETLTRMREDGHSFQIVELGRWYGEATALNVGIENARGGTILTLPSYTQIEPDGIPKVLDALKDADTAIAVRNRRDDSFWNRLQAAAFHRLLGIVAPGKFEDLGCGVRAFRAQVLDKIPVYGDQYRFLPILAARAGFRVEQVLVEQATEDKKTRIYRPGVYLRRLLDILTIFFLVKFTKKPLRFFGLLGVGTAALGGIALAWLIFERLFFDVALGDRPALLISTLLFAVGVQLVAVGLIGELIIFTHALEVKEYSVERVVGGEQSGKNQSLTGAASTSRTSAAAKTPTS